MMNNMINDTVANQEVANVGALAYLNTIKKMAGEKPISAEEFNKECAESKPAPETPETLEDIVLEIQARKRLGRNKSATAQVLVKMEPDRFKSVDEALKAADSLLRAVKLHGAKEVATEERYRGRAFRDYDDIKLLRAFSEALNILGSSESEQDSVLMAYLKAVLDSRGMLAKSQFQEKPQRADAEQLAQDLVEYNQKMERTYAELAWGDPDVNEVNNLIAKQQRDFLEDTEEKKPLVLTSKQGAFILKRLAMKGTCYVPDRLKGELAKYNGKTITVTMHKLAGIVAHSIRMRANNMKLEVSNEQVKEVLDELCRLKYLACVQTSYSNNKYGSYCQYFVAMKKIQDKLRASK